jgi:hypothetical protein
MLTRMQKTFKSRRARLVLGGVVFVAAIAGASLIARPIENKTDKIQPDWSRGTAIGFAPWNQPPAIAASDDGQHIHLIRPILACSISNWMRTFDG